LALAQKHPVKALEQASQQALHHGTWRSFDTPVTEFPVVIRRLLPARSWIERNQNKNTAG
jgi:hypothetical protein